MIINAYFEVCVWIPEVLGRSNKLFIQKRKHANIDRI